MKWIWIALYVAAFTVIGLAMKYLSPGVDRLPIVVPAVVVIIVVVWFQWKPWRE